MMDYLFWYFLVNTILCIVVGYVAQQKRRSFSGFFFLSFFLSFFVGILVILALPSARREIVEVNPDIHIVDGDKQLKCPYCAEWVKSEAKVCKHCGRDIGDHLVAALVTQDELELAQEVKRSQEEEIQREQARLSREQAAMERREVRRKISGSIGSRKRIWIPAVALATLLVLILVIVTKINFDAKQQVLFGLEQKLEDAQKSRYQQALHWDKTIGLCPKGVHGIKVAQVGQGILTLKVNYQISLLEANQVAWLDCLDKNVLEPGLQCPVGDYGSGCPLASILQEIGSSGSFDYWSGLPLGGINMITFTFAKPSNNPWDDWTLTLKADQQFYGLENCDAVIASNRQVQDMRKWPLEGAVNGSFGPYIKGIDREYAWFNDTNMDGVVCDGNDPMGPAKG